MSEWRDKRYFTIVFEGDLTKFPSNVFKTQFPVGEAIAAGFGNAFERINELEEELERHAR